MIVSIPGKDAKGNVAEFEAGFKWNNICFETLGTMKNISTLSAYTIAMLYCGYKGWCCVKQIDERLTLEDFSDWVDESPYNEERLQQIKLISEECAASPHLKRLTEVKKNEQLNPEQSAAA